MSEFKVGDKVRVIGSGLGAPYGEEFVITELVNPENPNRPGHYARGDRNGSGVWLEYLELVERVEPVPVIEVGSRVRLEDGTVGIIEEVLPPVTLPYRVGAVVAQHDIPSYILMHDDPEQYYPAPYRPWRSISNNAEAVTNDAVRAALDAGAVVLWEGRNA